MPIPKFPKPDHTLPTLPTGPNLVRRPQTVKQFSFEPSSRWVRAVVAGQAVVDSRHQLLVWEPDSKVAEYAFPLSHVRMDLLKASSGTPAAATKYWRPKQDVTWYDLAVGDKTISAAAWKWTTPGLEDWVGVTWHPSAGIEWFEEDEAVVAHPRAGARIDVIPSSRHVEVFSEGGVLLAESSGAVALFETNLPTRFYLPPGDVVWETLEGVELATVCPYKGTADRYWRVKGTKDAIAWGYTAPLPGVAGIKDRVAFYNEKVKLVVDGVPFEGMWPAKL